MSYRPAVDHRRSIRLAAYDYSEPGIYFVTLVSFRRNLLFGAVEDGAVELNSLGKIVEAEWVRSQAIRRELDLDAFVVMPNHVHGIVFLRAEGEDGTVGATGRSPRRFGSGEGPGRRSLGAFVGGLKAATTTRINTVRGTPGENIWQRNYYERVLRSDQELERARDYIRANPGKWAEDVNNPAYQVTPAAGREPRVGATSR